LADFHNGGTLPSRIEALNIDATGEQRVLALDLKSQFGISSWSRNLWTLIHINALWTPSGEIMYSSGIEASSTG
jgi:hypothetical protein